jgi:hypothetical protein
MIPENATGDKSTPIVGGQPRLTYTYRIYLAVTEINPPHHTEEVQSYQANSLIDATSNYGNYCNCPMQTCRHFHLAAIPETDH